MKIKRMLVVKVDEVTFVVEDTYKVPDWCPNGFFQDQFLAGWEKETLRVVKAFSNNRKGVLIDVGAWIGPITLYGAELYDRVVSFEPDPVALGYLKKNLSLSKGNNVTLFEKGVTATTSLEGQLFGGSTALGNSETTFLAGYDFFRYSAQRGSYKDRTSNLIKVSTITLEDALTEACVDPSDIKLIKVDIEGGEYFLIPAITPFLKTHKVPLLISLHYCFLPEKYVWSILETLFGIYTIIKDPNTDMQVELEEAKGKYLTDLLCIEPYDRTQV